MIQVFHLTLLLLECASENGTIDSVQEADASLETPVMGSVLFRQALFATALKTRNFRLAIDLIQRDPLDPPPPDQCIFKIWYSPLKDHREIPAGVHAAVVTAGWEEPSDQLAWIAAASPEPEEGIALFNALKGAGYDSWLTNRQMKNSFPGIALALSGPSLFQYLRDVYSITKPLTPNMLIQVAEARKSGGVEMLSWLLEQGLDINFMRVPDRPDRDFSGMDPRERAEQEMAYHQRPWSDEKTALHAAAWMGNVDAVRFLLEQGADPRMENGIGQTADVIARAGGHEEIANLVEREIGDSRTRCSVL